MLTPSDPAKEFEKFKRYKALLQEDVTKLFFIVMKSFPRGHFLSQPQSTKSRFAKMLENLRVSIAVMSRQFHNTEKFFYNFICDNKPGSYLKEQFIHRKEGPP